MAEPTAAKIIEGMVREPDQEDYAKEMVGAYLDELIEKKLETTKEDGAARDLTNMLKERIAKIDAMISSQQPVFTPYEVAPRMTNTPEVQRALARAYPTLLRDAGIGGSVLIWFFIDEEGTVQETVVNQSSGHFQLDEAALTVADIVRFTPAMNRDKVVPVWISLPITFEVR